MFEISFGIVSSRFTFSVHFYLPSHLKALSPGGCLILVMQLHVAPYRFLRFPGNPFFSYTLAPFPPSNVVRNRCNAVGKIVHPVIRKMAGALRILVYLCRNMQATNYLPVFDIKNAESIVWARHRTYTKGKMAAAAIRL